MATNINTELFKRYAPKKKLEIINSLTPSELLATSSATVIRIIKEAGHNHYRSRDKRLTISRDRRVGNDWNSTFEGIDLIKGKLYVDLYVQYGDCDTDTNESIEYSKFFRSGSYEGQIKGIDRHFNDKYYYYTYDQDDKIKCIKSILLEYVHTKYHDKLNNND